MGAADAYFECHAILSGQAMRDVDVEIGKRDKEALIVAMHRVTPLMMFTPRFILIPCPATERSHDPRQVVGVFSTHMFLDERKLSAGSVIKNSGHGSLRHNKVERSASGGGKPTSCSHYCQLSHSAPYTKLYNSKALRVTESWDTFMR
jgi:hypothetical protein